MMDWTTHPGMKTGTRATEESIVCCNAQLKCSHSDLGDLFTRFVWEHMLFCMFFYHIHIHENPYMLQM